MKLISHLAFSFIFFSAFNYAEESAVNLIPNLAQNPLPNLTPFLTQDSTSQNYFYFNQSYGSESQFGPLNVLLNVGLVVPGRLNTDARLKKIDYKAGFKNVKDALSHQQAVFTESGGTHESLKKEFIPFAHASGAWLPNYALHFLGEGMLSRKLQEYFVAKGVQGNYMPKILAISTVITAQLLNEVVEYELPWEQRLDSVADFYFNAAGIIAFSFDEVAALLNNDYVNYYYWPGQPVIDVQDGAIFNQGEGYFLRTTLGENTQWKFAFMAGMPANGVGLSLPLDEMQFEYLSILLGTDVLIPKPNQAPDADDLTRDDEFKAGDIAKQYNGALNLYWDRKGSLLASASLSFTPSYQINLNLYPIQNNDLGIAMGGYLIVSEEGASAVGITFDFMPWVPGMRD